MSRLNLALDVKHGAHTARKRREEVPLLSMSSLVATALDVSVILSLDFSFQAYLTEKDQMVLH